MGGVYGLDHLSAPLRRQQIRNKTIQARHLADDAIGRVIQSEAVYVGSGADIISASYAAVDTHSTVEVPDWASTVAVTIFFSGVYVTNTCPTNLRAVFDTDTGPEIRTGLEHMFGHTPSPTVFYGSFNLTLTYDGDCTAQQGQSVDVGIEGYRISGSGACRPLDRVIRTQFYA